MPRGGAAAWSTLPCCSTHPKPLPPFCPETRLYSAAGTQKPTAGAMEDPPPLGHRGSSDLSLQLDAAISSVRDEDLLQGGVQELTIDNIHNLSSERRGLRGRGTCREVIWPPRKCSASPPPPPPALTAPARSLPCSLAAAAPAQLLGVI